MATVSAAGEPEVRSVILRGISDAGQPYFFSDARTQKGAALANAPRLELCCYWRKTNEQFRLRGWADIISARDKPVQSDWSGRRLELWNAQNEANKALFLGAAPGTPLEYDHPPKDPSNEPPAHFILIILNPERVDYLKAQLHKRTLYRLKQGEWQMQEVVP